MRRPDRKGLLGGRGDCAPTKQFFQFVMRKFLKPFAQIFRQRLPEACVQHDPLFSILQCLRTRSTASRKNGFLSRSIVTVMDVRSQTRIGGPTTIPYLFPASRPQNADFRWYYVDR